MSFATSARTSAGSATGRLSQKRWDSRWCNQPVVWRFARLRRHFKRALLINKITNCLYFLSAVVLANVSYRVSQYCKIMLKNNRCGGSLSVIICPIAIAYSYGTDNKIGFRLSVCVSVCLSVCPCVITLTVAFLCHFHQIWHRGVNPQK